MISIENSNLTLPALDFCDVLIQPRNSVNINSRSQVDLEIEFWNRNETCGWRGIPIVASNMDTTGSFAVAKVFTEFKMMTFLSKHYTLEDYKKYDYDPQYIGVTIGLNEVDKLKEIINYNTGIGFICIDVANGYIRSFRELVKYVTETYPDNIIVAGNVVTYEGSSTLADICGADIVKCGIGSGSVCLTREKTGIGLPQFTTIPECAADFQSGRTEWYNPKIPVMSDGGCQNPGDIAKAFAAGARFVMIGGMLAGHDETGDKIYGMSSNFAMTKNAGSVADYKSAEGKLVEIPTYSGRPLADKVKDILGGLRSACTYTGHLNLDDFISAPHQFRRVNRQLNNFF
jgi:GMP reductase